jgi:hypothetical protein
MNVEEKRSNVTLQRDQLHVKIAYHIRRDVLIIQGKYAQSYWLQEINHYCKRLIV